MRATHSTGSVKASLKRFILPKEHGTWSLVLEPLVFGLLIAPSMAGSFLCLAVLIAAFARRPLRIAVAANDPSDRIDARKIASGMLLAAGVAFGATLVLGGIRPGLFLIPSLIAGLVFLWLDRKGEAREAAAELAGSCALAFVPAGIAAYGAHSTASSFAVAFVMLARVIPTILLVRSYLRFRKGGPLEIMPSLGAHIAMLLSVTFLNWQGLAPQSAVIMLTLLLVRAFFLLIWPRPQLRPKQIGIIESIAGACFVIWVGVSW